MNRCVRHQTMSIKEAGERGWCRVCKSPCIKYQIIEFAEYMGKKGFDVNIINKKGETGVCVGPLKNKEFQKALKEFQKARG